MTYSKAAESRESYSSTLTEYGGPSFRSPSVTAFLDQPNVEIIASERLTDRKNERHEHSTRPDQLSISRCPRSVHRRRDRAEKTGDCAGVDQISKIGLVRRRELTCSHRRGRTSRGQAQAKERSRAVRCIIQRPRSARPSKLIRAKTLTTEHSRAGSR